MQKIPLTYCTSTIVESGKGGEPIVGYKFNPVRKNESQVFIWDTLHLKLRCLLQFNQKWFISPQFGPYYPNPFLPRVLWVESLLLPDQAGHHHACLQPRSILTSDIKHPHQPAKGQRQWNLGTLPRYSAPHA